jgi:hypothetical protein
MSTPEIPQPRGSIQNAPTPAIIISPRGNRNYLFFSPHPQRLYHPADPAPLYLTTARAHVRLGCLHPGRTASTLDGLPIALAGSGRPTGCPTILSVPGVSGPRSAGAVASGELSMRRQPGNRSSLGPRAASDPPPAREPRPPRWRPPSTHRTRPTDPAAVTTTTPSGLKIGPF